ncbi:hypothetical protein H8959_017561 [Pygathrix nigripes]
MNYKDIDLASQPVYCNLQTLGQAPMDEEDPCWVTQGILTPPGPQFPHLKNGDRKGSLRPQEALPPPPCPLCRSSARSAPRGRRGETPNKETGESLCESCRHPPVDVQAVLNKCFEADEAQENPSRPWCNAASSEKLSLVSSQAELMTHRHLYFKSFFRLMTQLGFLSAGPCPILQSGGDRTRDKYPQS